MPGKDRKAGAKALVSKKPVTASYLRKAALHYISSRSASIAMVRQTLKRRALRRTGTRVLEPDTTALIETAIAELVELGLLDDSRFAGARAATLGGKGLPRGRIALGLRAKGLDEATIETAVGRDIDDLAQARRFIERKRLGGHRSGGQTPDTRRKDLAALARAGFTFGTAARALDQPEDE